MSISNLYAKKIMLDEIEKLQMYSEDVNEMLLMTAQDEHDISINIADSRFVVPRHILIIYQSYLYEMVRELKAKVAEL